MNRRGKIWELQKYWTTRGNRRKESQGGEGGWVKTGKFRTDKVIRRTAPKDDESPALLGAYPGSPAGMAAPRSASAIGGAFCECASSAGTEPRVTFGGAQGHKILLLLLAPAIRAGQS